MACDALPGASPKIVIAPAEGRSVLTMARTSVVLPAPLGPKMPTNSPTAISALTSWRIVWPPRARLRLVMERAAGIRSTLARDRFKASIDRFQLVIHPGGVGLELKRLR